MTEWRDVPQFEGYYQVSDHGRVRSVDRTVIRRRIGATTYRGKELRIATDPRGRRHIGLYREGREYRRYVAHLVAAAFIGPRPHGALVCHYDDDPANNAVGNLRYGTRRDNKADELRNGLNVNARKTECKRGHALFPPNLVTTNPGRQCLACKTAKNRARGKQWTEKDLQDVSDTIYNAQRS